MQSFSFITQKFVRTIFVLCLASSSYGIADEDSIDVPQQITLGFQEAYNLALENNIMLLSAELDVGISQAEKMQVGLYPNPELNISLDGPSNMGNWNDCNGNDFSIGITQLFELGGKRRARVRVADAVQSETGWSLEIAKCDLYAKVMHAFIDTVVAQEMLALANDFQNIAEQSFTCIFDKKECGKASPLEVKKAEIALKMAKLNYNKRYAEFQKAKSELAFLWNSTQPHFGCVEYDLFNIAPPSPYCQLEQELENNPELARAHAEVSKAWEIVQLQQAQRIPNMAVYLGVSTTRNLHDPALSFGVSVPLPVFDRNQGNIARADLELNQVMLKQNDLVNKLKIRMKILYREWSSAYRQVADLKEMIETTAGETFKLAEERYTLGDCDYLNYLEARSTLFNMKQQYLIAVDEYHHKRAEIMQLLAKCCTEVFN